jgi:hypothetical protein
MKPGPDPTAAAGATVKITVRLPLAALRARDRFCAENKLEVPPESSAAALNADPQSGGLFYGAPRRLRRFRLCQVVQPPGVSRGSLLCRPAR